jgi:hypothetical protein
MLFPTIGGATGKGLVFAGRHNRGVAHNHQGLWGSQKSA